MMNHHHTGRPTRTGRKKTIHPRILLVVGEKRRGRSSENGGEQVRQRPGLELETSLDGLEALRHFLRRPQKVPEAFLQRQRSVGEIEGEKLRRELAGHGQHFSGFFDLATLDVPSRLPNEDLAVLGQVAHPPFHFLFPEEIDLLPGLFLLPDLQELLAAEPYRLEFVERG